MINWKKITTGFFSKHQRYDVSVVLPVVRSLLPWRVGRAWRVVSGATSCDGIPASAGFAVRRPHGSWTPPSSLGEGPWPCHLWLDKTSLRVCLAWSPVYSQRTFLWELSPQRSGLYFPSVDITLVCGKGSGKISDPLWLCWINQLVMGWLGASGCYRVGVATVPRPPSHTSQWLCILPNYTWGCWVQSTLSIHSFGSLEVGVWGNEVLNYPDLPFSPTSASLRHPLPSLSSLLP